MNTEFKNKEPLISISCITYNHANYIRDAIEGFLKQKTSFKFEVLIHDDASTDGTDEIIREYEAKYPDIIKPLYETENQWVKGRRGSVIFNFPRALGKYIAPCEGDDYWTDPYKLQKQVDFLEANPECSLCFHNAIVKYENIKRKPHLFNKIKKSQYIDLKTLINSWIVPTASIVFVKEKVLPLPSWTNQIYSGDMTLALQAFRKGKLYFFEDVMSVYRKRYEETSLSYIADKKHLYVNEQHMLLYKLYNQDTNYCHNNILSNIIKQLYNDKKFVVLRRKSLLLPIIFMPLVSMTKLNRYIKRVLFK